MGDNLVSIGIPAYNNPAGLKRTVECIRKQTYKNIEIIISEDGSCNKEIDEIVEYYKKIDNRVKAYIHKENRGGFFNFGFVLSKSKGDYYMWASDDDEWDELYIEKCLQELKDKDFDMVFSHFNLISNKDKRTIRFNHNRYLNSKYNREIFLLLDECITHKANLLYGLWKKNVILEKWDLCLENGFNQSYMGKGFDNAFLMLIIGTCKIYQLPEVLFFKHYDNRFIPGSYKALFFQSIYNISSLVRRPVKHLTSVYLDTKKQKEIIKNIYKESYFIINLKIFLYIVLRHIF